MSDWDFVTKVPSEQLARLHFFTMKKPHPSGPVEMRITVTEYALPEIPAQRFFAQTDLELNQKTAPFRPVGWGETLMSALSECLRNIRKFEYEGPVA
jgi:hypothetical protein